MAKTLKITTKDELFRHAGGLVLKSNLEELIDTSVIENTYKYADKLQKIKDITQEDGAWKLIDDTTTHLAEYAEIEGEYIAHLVAANLCNNDHGIDGVHFDVSNKIKKEITNSLAEYEKQYLEKKEVLDESFTVLNYITYNENEEEFQRAKETLGNTELLSESNLRKRHFENAKMTLNMYACENLTMDNYAERLSDTKDEAAKEWATAAVENMVRGLYTNEEYSRLSGKEKNIINSIYIDGKPAAVKYKSEEKYSEKCAAIISDVLSGKHKINVCGMKEVNGQFIETDEVVPVKVEPQVVCEEKFSLWKAILRFFGIGKTEKQKFEEKISLAQLDNDDSISKITKYDLIRKDFSEKIEPVRDAHQKYAAKIENVNAYAFKENLENPNNYFIKASMYYEYNGTGNLQLRSYLASLSRSTSRTSLLVTYAMGKGMEFDSILNPSEADKEQLKAYGKEFIDIVTLPQPEEIAKQVYPDYDDAQLGQVIKTNDEQFRKTYDKAVDAKCNEIIEMYGNMTKVLSEFEGTLHNVNYMDAKNVIDEMPRHLFYSTACCDLYQVMQNSPLRKKSDIISKACEYGSDGQFKTSLRSYISALSIPDISTRVPTSDALLGIGSLLSIISNEQDPAHTLDGDIMSGHHMAQFQAAFTKELSDSLSSDEYADVFTYARDIITGKKPIPEGLITSIEEGDGFKICESHLMECYREDKAKQAEKTLGNSKAL